MGYIFLALVAVVIIFAWFSEGLSSSSPSQPTSQPQQPPEKAWYTTSLRMSVRSEVGPSTLFCKAGVVYDSATPSENSAIGFYELRNNLWYVYCDANKEYEIGHFSSSSSSGDIYIWLSLYGKVKYAPYLHQKAVASPHGFTWAAAECCVGGEKVIIDHDSYDLLGRYQGNPVEAAAAFIAWAYESWGNKYNDYYRI